VALNGFANIAAFNIREKTNGNTHDIHHIHR
jgi:hypothetical protein